MTPGRAAALLITLACLMLTVGCAATTGDRREADQPHPTRDDWTYHPGPVADEPVLDLDTLIHQGDRLVFVGDEMTQQMFYTRAVATGLLAVLPDHALHLYNGGRDGATAESALTWVEPLLTLTRAQVALVVLGLNDAFLQPEDGSPYDEAWRTHLTALTRRIKTHPGMREVILIGPPAIQAGLSEELAPDSYNARLLTLSQIARQVARDEQVHYIDLFIHTSAVYLGQMKVGGDPLTLGGRLPSEAGHVIIASVLLRGMGVTGRQLDAVGYSPLLPSQMGRIRPALALETSAPSPDLANASRSVYLTLARHDEAFFKQWRLAGRNRLSWTPQEAAAQVELAWGHVQTQAAQWVRLAGSDDAAAPSQGRP